MTGKGENPIRGTHERLLSGHWASIPLGVHRATVHNVPRVALHSHWQAGVFGHHPQSISG